MKRPAIWLAVLVVGAALVHPADAVRPKDLPEEWRRWLEEEVYPIISEEERKVFLALETNEQREEMAKRLWALWGDESGLGAGAFRRLYEDRVEECRTEFNNTIEERARLLLIHGPADVRLKVDCTEIFQPLEVWTWAYLPGIGRDVTVVFYRPYGLGGFRLWQPVIEGDQVLYTYTGWQALQNWMKSGQLSQVMRPELACADGLDLLRAIDRARYWLNDLQVQRAMQHVIRQPSGKGRESAAQRFLEFSAVAPKGAAKLAFDVTAAVGNRRGGKLGVTFSMRLPRAGLASSKVGDVEVVQLDVTGEVMREGTLADQFRYAFTFPAESVELPVVIERELRPGNYTLRVKVQDGNASHAGVKEVPFEVAVPVLPTPGPIDKAATDAVARVAEAREATLMLRGAEGDGVSGVQRFSALVGPTVARVEFYLDGRLVLVKNRPPFDVDLDIGPVPRLASVTAVAFDAKGSELDRRQLDLNVGKERFHVRLQPVSGADRKQGKVHVQAAVNVPRESKLARLELYWNETLVQTLYSPPFDAWLPVKDDGSVGYVRAFAVLDNGEQAEDVQFVNAPQFLTGVQVHTVELPVTVLAGRKPVDGLTVDEFEVLEDGAKQTISNFALHRDLPVRLGVVLDTSGSMEPTLPAVQKVVLGFLHTLLRPKDRAFVVAFSDQAMLLEGFTADFQALERALIALRADRETALWDATVFSLFQFSGVRGRKAMVLLTDGDDNASRLEFDRALDYAKRSGVTIYTIGIDLPLTKVTARSRLSRLAQVTGGEAFFLARDSDLAHVYAQIDRELRSQYLLTYTSTSEAPADVFRKITVRLKRPKVEIRTITGYYPAG
jgi:Ca-activated chloride channel family protein